MASELLQNFKICEIFAVCLAHAIGKLIRGYKSKTLCRRIYDTVICGRWTDINPVNDQIAVPRMVHSGQGDYTVGCACSVVAFSCSRY